MAAARTNPRRIGRGGGLLGNVALDHLPRNLITEGTGQRFEIVEFCPPGHTAGEDLHTQFSRHPRQHRAKLIWNPHGILAHLRSPIHVVWAEPD
jgi:hypothetical protein